MASIVKSLRALSDPLRLRLVLLLRREELSVAEIQEALGMGQSRISTHLAQLKQAGLVEDRRSGKNILYRLEPDVPPQLLEVLEESAREIPETERDLQALALILRNRLDKTRAYFDELAGRFGRQYVPGRSWKALAESLLVLLPPMVIADLGAGEGTFTQLLSRQAKQVIAVDNSPKMVEFASDLARKNGVTNVEFRLGDLESPPIAPATCDLVFLSQSLHHALHPAKAVAAAFSILKPGGRVVILDLKRHAFEEAREMYADIWLGFAEVELDAFLREAGFVDIRVVAVHREKDHPYFETLMAVGAKA